jgi:hypothetical protein
VDAQCGAIIPSPSCPDRTELLPLRLETEAHYKWPTLSTGQPRQQVSRSASRSARPQWLDWLGRRAGDRERVTLCCDASNDPSVRFVAPLPGDRVGWLRETPAATPVPAGGFHVQPAPCSWLDAIRAINQRLVMPRTAGR